jgi:predicted methyltransferase
MKNALCALVFLLGCASSAPRPTADAASIVNAPERPAEDKALDAHRKPEEMLKFFAARIGMRVADLAAGGGYTTELLARAVGPEGAVFSQNPPPFVKFAGEAWTKRLAEPALKNTVRVERPMEDPLPPEATNLDLVVSHVIYHDTVWMGVDRDRMNKAIFAALKPGGAYVVIDSSAKAGSGVADAQTLHQLAEKSDAWRNPEDTRDWSTSPRNVGERRGTGDRFAFKFVKP